MSHLIISSILVLVSLVAVVFAWFNLSNKTPPIIIILGRIEVAAHLYEVNDTIESEITESIFIDKVVPGDYYLYKLTIENKGTLTGDLNVSIHFDSNNSNLMNYVSFEEIETSTILFSEGPYTYNSVLEPSTETVNNSITLWFKVVIDSNLELHVLNGLDYLEITSIKVELAQQTY